MAASIGLMLAGEAVQAQQSAVPANPSIWRSSSAVAAPSKASAPDPIILSYYKEPEPPPAQPKPAPPGGPYPRAKDASASLDDTENPIPLGLGEGGPNEVVRLESEANFRRRLTQKNRQKSDSGAERTTFPEEPVVSTTIVRSVARAVPGHMLLVEPAYVCHGPLWFEERNAERYGWDLGIIQPPIQAGIFFADVLTLPYHMGVNLTRGPECSAGQCLPGDPVPYLLYPPQLSFSGGVLQAGAVVGMIAAFP
jgi:hypothetical protein